MNSDIADIIKRLEKQAAAIAHAISVLQEIDDDAAKQPATRKRGRPKKAAGAKRILSAEARERIAAAQRKRWAAAKKAAKKKTAGKRAA